jgi:hypothetical protein
VTAPTPGQPPPEGGDAEARAPAVDGSAEVGRGRLRHQVVLVEPGEPVVEEVVDHG